VKSKVSLISHTQPRPYGEMSANPKISGQMSGVDSHNCLSNRAGDDTIS
jgi:hypothetical protein